MLTRREAIAAGAAAVLGGTAAAGAGAPPLRPLWRWETGRWVRRRMFELRVGDVFCLGVAPGEKDADLDLSPVRVTTAPQKTEAGMWGVTVLPHDGPPLTPPAPSTAAGAPPAATGPRSPGR